MVLTAAKGQQLPLESKRVQLLFQGSGTQPVIGGPKISAQIFGYEKYVTAISRGMQEYSLSDREEYDSLTFRMLLDKCADTPLSFLRFVLQVGNGYQR